jgi:hypothetical protein
VKLWPKLGGCLLLLVACRQPNPEWEGAAEGMATSDPPPTSSETGGGPGPNVDGPEVMTEGQDCNNDQMCPGGWVCGPMGCQQGGDGDPCNGSGDCQAPTNICGPGDVCQAGAAGDPCSSPAHCADGVMCMNDVCGGSTGSSSTGSSGGDSSSSSTSSSSGDPTTSGSTTQG